ncbi:MAG: hypothetical protein OEW60_08245 [Thiovulaceae bacterium]|nr:hypothetical protein [Sulfurimonadaceae bacterium]
MKILLFFLLPLTFLFSEGYFEDNLRANIGLAIDQRSDMGVHFDYNFNFLAEFSLGFTFIGSTSTKYGTIGNKNVNIYGHVDYDLSDDFLIFFGFGSESYNSTTSGVSTYNIGALWYYDIWYIKLENTHRIEPFNDNTYVISFGLSLDRNYHLNIK